jgi:hypothetical protein
MSRSQRRNLLEQIVTVHTVYSAAKLAKAPMHPVTRMALEWFLNSGARSPERLRMLVWETGTNYNYSGETLEAMLAEAMAALEAAKV